MLEKRHPLLDGVVLGGVVFGGVQPVAVAGKQLEAAPLVSAGKQLLLSRLIGTQTAAYLLNLDFARSNLAESPDWPILIKNLVELCREARFPDSGVGIIASTKRSRSAPTRATAAAIR